VHTPTRTSDWTPNLRLYCNIASLFCYIDSFNGGYAGDAHFPGCPAAILSRLELRMMRPKASMLG